MKFKKPSSQGWSNIAMDLTPLIDIVFLLLIFFLLTAAPAPEPTMRVTLPESEKGELLTLPKEVTLTLHKDGSIFLEGRLTSIDNLPNTLKSLKKTKNISRLILRGDTKAQYGMVVKIIEAVTKAELPLGIAIKQRDSYEKK